MLLYIFPFGFGFVPKKDSKTAAVAAAVAADDGSQGRVRAALNRVNPFTLFRFVGFFVLTDDDDDGESEAKNGCVVSLQFS